MNSTFSDIETDTKGAPIAQMCKECGHVTDQVRQIAHTIKIKVLQIEPAAVDSLADDLMLVNGVKFQAEQFTRLAEWVFGNSVPKVSLRIAGSNRSGRILEFAANDVGFFDVVGDQVVDDVSQLRGNPRQRGLWWLIGSHDRLEDVWSSMITLTVLDGARVWVIVFLARDWHL